MKKIALFVLFVLASFAVVFGQVGTVTDVEGNVYPTKVYGKTEWMTQNLYTRTYADGSAIPQGNGKDITLYKQKESSWPIGYSNYYYLTYYYINYDSISKWGMIYTDLAAAKSAGLCPDGWRVPSKADWDELINMYGGYGGYSKAGKELKSACPLKTWKFRDPDTVASGVWGALFWGSNDNDTIKDATNSSGFNANPELASWYHFDWSYNGYYLTSYIAHDTSANHWTWKTLGTAIEFRSDRDYAKYLANYYGFVRCVRDAGPITGMTDEDAKANDNFELWPNPVMNSLSVSVDAAAEVSAYDLSGKQVGSWKVNAGRTLLDVGFLPEGGYVFRITGGGKSTITKLIKK